MRINQEKYDMADQTPKQPPVLKVKTGIRGGQQMGDAVADVARATGLDKGAELYTQITGRDCGCEQRRQLLNSLSA
jgi:hypothetical protein